MFVRSIRVSNELGAGRPQAARLATRVVMLLAFSLGVSEGLVMVLARNDGEPLPHLFITVVRYVQSCDDHAVQKLLARPSWRHAGPGGGLTVRL
jgi:Na+-driven multidrug efflux pump